MSKSTTLVFSTPRNRNFDSHASLGAATLGMVLVTGTTFFQLQRMDEHLHVPRRIEVKMAEYYHPTDPLIPPPMNRKEKYLKPQYVGKPCQSVTKKVIAERRSKAKAARKARKNK